MLLEKGLDGFLKVEASKPGAKSSLIPNALVNVNSLPLYKDSELAILNEGTVEYATPCFIKYQPMQKKGLFEGLDFIIGTSMLPDKDRVRIGSYQDLVDRANQGGSLENEVIRFILDNSDMCEDYFILARRNCGMRIYFCFDMLSLAKKVNPKWNVSTTFGANIDSYANEVYTICRGEGLKEKNNEDAKAYYKNKQKLKEAKRCQQ